MSETNTTENTVEANEATVTKLYATRTECEANKPADAPKSLKVFAVSKSGAAVGFMWGRGYADTLADIARRDGYTVSLGNSKPVTKEAVAGALAAMTDADRAELLKAYLPAPAPTGRGRKQTA